MKRKFFKPTEDFVNAVKLHILCIIMFLGFLLAYSFVWFILGLPQTDWAQWVWVGLSLLSECLYFKWLNN